MKLVRYTHQDKTNAGVLVDGQVVDLNLIMPGVGDDMRRFLTAGPDALRAARELVTSKKEGVALKEVKLESPITNPQKFLAIGMNYKAHAEEAARADLGRPTSQLWFNKQVSCITGPFDPVHIPQVAPDQVDYEGELGIIIGKRCRGVQARDARSVVAGYCVINDVSVRDWQRRATTFTLGKSWDTHGPVGPWITTADEIEDPHALRVRTLVNGEVRQDESTALLIYDLWQQIEYLSTVMTLEPGDLLATGTPAGVGMSMEPPCYLSPGDVVRISIDGVGEIENRFVTEPV